MAARVWQLKSVAHWYSRTANLVIFWAFGGILGVTIVAYFLLPIARDLGAFGREFIVVNSPHSDILSLSLRLDDFDFDARRLTVDYQIRRGARAVELDPVPNTFFISFSGGPFEEDLELGPHPSGVQTVTYRFSGNFVEEFIDDDEIDSEGGEKEFGLSGDEFWFPFDVYRGGISASGKRYSPYGTRDEFLGDSNAPFFFIVEDSIQGVSVEAESLSDDSIAIRLRRSELTIGIFIIAAVMLMLIAVIYLLLAFRTKSLDLPLLISGVGLFLGVPSLRTAIVPSYVQSVTLVDLIFFIPFSSLFIGTSFAIIAIIRNQRRKAQR